MGAVKNFIQKFETQGRSRFYFCFKIVLNCNSLTYKQIHLSDARLMKNIIKKTTCKLACVIIFQQLYHSRTLSPSSKDAYISLKQSYKTPVKKDLMRIILFRTYEHLKLYIILYIFHVLMIFFIYQTMHSRKQSSRGVL